MNDHECRVGLLLSSCVCGLAQKRYESGSKKRDEKGKDKSQCQYGRKPFKGGRLDDFVSASEAEARCLSLITVEGL